MNPSPLRFFALSAPLLGLAQLLSCSSEEPAVPLPDGSSSSATASTGTGAGGGGPTGGGIISASTESAFETSPTLAVADGGRLAVAWVGQPAEGPSHIGYSTSIDGGVSWTQPQIITSPDGEILDSPDLVADRGGTFHLAFLGYHRDTQGGTVYVASSSADGTFGAPEVVSDPEVVGIYERPRAALTKKGSVMVAYGELVGGYSKITTATSYQGEDWRRVMIPSGDEEHARQPYPCAAPPGGAAVGRTWIASRLNGRTRLFYSDDDGDSWTGSSEVAGDGSGPGPTCVGDGNEVWVSVGALDPDRRFGELATIVVAHSLDGGDSWADYVEVHDGEVAPFFANHQLVLEDDGALNVIYYAGAGQGDTVGAVRRTRWTQVDVGEGGGEPGTGGAGGAPEGKPSEIVHEPIGFDLARTSDEWIGDSVGFAFSEGKLYAAYVDNAEVVAHVAFLRIDQP